MINQKFFQKLKADFKKAEENRREVLKIAGDALLLAKRAIFSFHRDDWKGGEQRLKESLANLKKAAKLTDLAWKEGSFRAALEEYSEAELFRQFLYKEKLGDVKGMPIDYETYLGALSDTTGEILRYAVKKATERQSNEVQRAKEAVDEIMGQLIELNLTGYLRTKYDQAKQARRRLEQVVYDLSLRR